jgi:hypothetical protein
MGDVEKIVKESDGANLPIQDSTRHRVAKLRYFGLYRIGYFPNPYYNSATTGSIVAMSALEGAYIGKYYSIAAGVEYDVWTNSLGQTLPVFLDMREYFMTGQFTPLVFLDCGYEFGWGSIVNTNLLLNFGVGLRTFVGRTTALWLDVGYELQPIWIQEFPTEVTKAAQAGFSVRAGISF